LNVISILVGHVVASRSCCSRLPSYQELTQDVEDRDTVNALKNILILFRKIEDNLRNHFKINIHLTKPNLAELQE